MCSSCSCQEAGTASGSRGHESVSIPSASDARTWSTYPNHNVSHRPLKSSEVKTCLCARRKPDTPLEHPILDLLRRVAVPHRQLRVLGSSGLC